MNETLHQLGGLLLGSVPTIFLFLLIVILYRFLVYGPLTRVLNERRERTEGAIEQAHAAIAAAAAKTQEYEAQLRAARSRIFQTRQKKQEELNRARDRAIARVNTLAEMSRVPLESYVALYRADLRKELENHLQEARLQQIKLLGRPELTDRAKALLPSGSN